MKDFLRKAVVGLVCMTMIFSTAVVTFAEDAAPCPQTESGGITVVLSDGTNETITADEITAAAKVTVTEAEPWSFGSAENPTYAYGTFYSMSDILTNAAIDLSEVHGIKSVASDGFTVGYSMDELESLYIFDQGEVTKGGQTGTAGTYGFAINGSAGNKWAKNVVSVQTVDSHLWFVKKGTCYHYCSICGEAEPSIIIGGEKRYLCEISGTIDEMTDTITTQAAKIDALQATVTISAKATAYNKVSLEAKAEGEKSYVLKVEKQNANGDWDAVELTDGKYIDTVALGEVNNYRVMAGVEYTTGGGENAIAYSDKYQTASAKTALKKAAVSKLSVKSKKITVKWNAVPGATSYDVYIGTNSSVTKGVIKYTGVKSLSKTTKALTKGKKYYVKVRAKSGSVYGAWSTPKAITCK